jgi:hypothetical protein
MCKKTNYKSCNTQIDKCIRPLIKWLLKAGYAPVGSCCGHGKYPMTIVVRYIENGKPTFYELLSNTKIPRSRRYYKRDEGGYYYIPEIIFKQNLSEE